MPYSDFIYRHHPLRHKRKIAPRRETITYGERIYYISIANVLEESTRREGSFRCFEDSRTWARWDRSNTAGWMPTSDCRRVSDDKPLTELDLEGPAL